MRTPGWPAASCGDRAALMVSLARAIACSGVPGLPPCPRRRRPAQLMMPDRTLAAAIALSGASLGMKTCSGGSAAVGRAGGPKQTDQDLVEGLVAVNRLAGWCPAAGRLRAQGTMRCVTAPKWPQTGPTLGQHAQAAPPNNLPWLDSRCTCCSSAHKRVGFSQVDASDQWAGGAGPRFWCRDGAQVLCRITKLACWASTGLNRRA